MSSDCLGYGNTLSLSTSTDFVVGRNGCDDLSPLQCMIDDPSDDISLNVKMQDELIKAERQNFVFQFTYNANLK